MHTEGEVLSEITDVVSQGGHTLDILGRIKSGKEATVYSVHFDGTLAALKVYKNPECRNFDNTGIYSAGKHYLRPSHRKALAKKNAFSKKLRHDSWVAREFAILEKLHKRGAYIPQPLLHVDHAIIMEFLGDEHAPAPRLHDVQLTTDEAKRAYADIVGTMKIFWQEGIVHADLSAFNILWWHKKPYIIDFPQSVDRRTHPDAEDLLDRDIKNIAAYFGKVFALDTEVANHQITNS